MWSSQSLTRDEVTQVLEKHFRYASLRPGQYEAVEAVMRGKDVFVRMGTGSGKSLCMFLPPLCHFSDNIAVAVIVSPLNGLMVFSVLTLIC